MASVSMFRLLLLSLSVGRQSVSATVTAVNEPSVSAVVSFKAITGLQIRRHFRLRPKPEKVVSVGLYSPFRLTGYWRKQGCHLLAHMHDCVHFDAG